MSSSTSKREYAIDYVGKGRKTGASAGGGNVLLITGVHALDGPEHSAASDLTRLDASSSAHGLLPKLSGAVLDLLRGDGTFGTAAASHVTVADAGSYLTATDVEAALQELGAKELGYTAHGALGSTETFSALVSWHSGTFSANCTATFSGATSGLASSMILELTSDGSSVMTWPGSVVWAGGSAPTLSTSAGHVDVILFMSRDGGTTWYGFPTGGSGSGATFATPAIVLGTTAAGGAASTVIRSDATIVAFDATVPVTQAVGDSAATGSAAVAARRDHKHALTRPSLDDLSDVVITSAASGDRVRFNGSNFVNSALRWEPHVDYTGSVVLDGNGDPVMVEVA